MGAMSWSQDELLRLIRAWQECLKASKNKSGKAKKKKTTTAQFNKRVYQRFQELSRGSSQRSLVTVSNRRQILQNSYIFIVSFVNDTETNGGVEWFALTTNDQRALMKTAGGSHVQPLEEKVFTELDKFLGKELAEAKESEAESESSQTTETEGNSSEGDKYEKVVHQKRTAAKKMKKKPRVEAKSSGEALSVSALEEEDGELIDPKEENVKSKRRRVTSPKKPATTDLNAILDRQSQVLAGFMDKRAEERTREHERSREEREADQMFWAAETAKDRALLRELFN